jgi:hypothetical protein
MTRSGPFQCSAKSVDTELIEWLAWREKRNRERKQKDRLAAVTLKSDQVF